MDRSRTPFSHEPHEGRPADADRDAAPRPDMSGATPRTLAIDEARAMARRIFEARRTVFSELAK
ncbi:hypothetical protein [Aurantimonas sp. Leaf443]|uniref:hypothetical protein n=1 Tax=Aurantimonas sp. Leaf443 TaxID=1736378 RepID=UPI0006FF7BDD|nr:hypothetical protein [Aurantimonas sp. Leaf443]KQT86185.1 hypothetical protein ASG48_06330 [Aurantimonas sp. Leaf443]